MENYRLCRDARARGCSDTEVLIDENGDAGERRTEEKFTAPEANKEREKERKKDRWIVREEERGRADRQRQK